ncbi:hypothetical protein ACJIZ3_001488 [Penstemon smallii]|uniref:Uncharacterized protein n=1 Tax=Penstemon smallii TaxID=265156 RepID=A0ABD3U442_9LAMI
MTYSITGQQKISKRRKTSVVNDRNVRAKSEEEKYNWKRDLMKRIKEKYHLLSVSERLPFIKIKDDKKAMYKEYKEKLPQGVSKVSEISCLHACCFILA